MRSVCLVDDSPTILMSMAAIFGKAGWSVKQAPGGAEALTAMKGTKVDLVVTDLNMPGMDGITLIKHVRQIPACRFMPILVLTTESQQSKRQEAKSAGATGWLVKPVGAADLLQVLKQLFPAG
jgi:two-component system chemotaxis response regulator CheY